MDNFQKFTDIDERRLNHALQVQGKTFGIKLQNKTKHVMREGI